MVRNEHFCLIRSLWYGQAAACLLPTPAGCHPRTQGTPAGLPALGRGSRADVQVHTQVNTHAHVHACVEDPAPGTHRPALSSKDRGRVVLTFSFEDVIDTSQSHPRGPPSPQTRVRPGLVWGSCSRQSGAQPGLGLNLWAV